MKTKVHAAACVQCITKAVLFAGRSRRLVRLNPLHLTVLKLSMQLTLGWRKLHAEFGIFDDLLEKTFVTNCK